MLIAAMVVTVVTFAGDKSFTSKDKDFEIAFPKAWDVHRPLEGVTYWAESTKVQADTVTKSAKVNVRVDAFQIPENSSLKLFVESDAVQKYFRPRESATKTEVTVAGAPAIKYEETRTGFRESAKRIDKVWQYYLVGSTHGYAIEIWATGHDPDAFAKDFEAILKSFKMLGSEKK